MEIEQIPTTHAITGPSTVPSLPVVLPVVLPASSPASSPTSLSALALTLAEAALFDLIGPYPFKAPPGFVWVPWCECQLKEVSYRQHHVIKPAIKALSKHS